MKTIRGEWLRRGITVSTEEKDGTVDYRQIRHKGERFKAIPLNPEVIEKLGFDFERDSPT